MATGARKDPHIIAFFKVEIDGLESGSFRACRGLKTESEIFEYQEGGNNETVYKLVGPTKHPNLVLTQGFISDPGFFKWRDEIHTFGAGKGIKRRNGAVVALAADGKEIGRWSFEKAWPVRWEMSDWDSTSSQAATETIELACERVTKAK